MKRRGFIGSIMAAGAALFGSKTTAERELPPDLNSMLIRLEDAKRWTAGMQNKGGPPGVSLAKKYGRRRNPWSPP